MKVFETIGAEHNLPTARSEPEFKASLRVSCRLRTINGNNSSTGEGVPTTDRIDLTAKAGLTFPPLSRIGGTVRTTNTMILHARAPR